MSGLKPKEETNGKNSKKHAMSMTLLLSGEFDSEAPSYGCGLSLRVKEFFPSCFRRVWHLLTGPCDPLYWAANWGNALQEVYNSVRYTR